MSKVTTEADQVGAAIETSGTNVSSMLPSNNIDASSTSLRRPSRKSDYKRNVFSDYLLSTVQSHCRAWLLVSPSPGARRRATRQIRREAPGPPRLVLSIRAPGAVHLIHTSCHGTRGASLSSRRTFARAWVCSAVSLSHAPSARHVGFPLNVSDGPVSRNLSLFLCHSFPFVPFCLPLPVD